MPRPPSHRLAVALLLGLIVLAAPPPVFAASDPPSPFALAVRENDIDWEHSAVFLGDTEVARAPREALTAVLGLKPDGTARPWSTGPLVGEIRHFRIAFARPLSVGTVCTDFGGDGGRVSLLREGAAVPGDVADEGAWLELGRTPVRPVAPGLRTRAVRVTFQHFTVPWAASAAPASLRCLILLSGRFYCPLDLGGGQTPFTSGLTDWQPTSWQRGADHSDIATLCWPLEQTLAGLLLAEVPRKGATLAYLSDDWAGHALSAPASAWRPLALPTEGAIQPVTAFRQPVTTRGLRLTAANYRTSPSQAPPILPLVALGAGEQPPLSFLKPPPFTFGYEMPFDGFMAIRVSRDDGTDVRRLLAETERARGAVAEGWDLKDDAGSYVRPGTYHWRALARPPLKLTYEMTVYSAGRPPWRAPVKGGGFWMADHCPPLAACAVGDTMFFGTLGAEFGDPLIATDLDGNKIWHHDQGVQRLTSDGRFAYVVNGDAVLRIDPGNGFRVSKILTFAYSDALPGHGGADWGAGGGCCAARPGLLCVSYDAPEPPWIASAFPAGAVDLPACFPPPSNEKVHETAYTPEERILGAFLTVRSSTSAYFGDAVKSGPLAGTLLLALKKEVPVGSVLLPDGRMRVYALGAGKKLPAEFSPHSGPSAEGIDPEEGLDLPGGSGIDLRFDRAVWTPLAASGKPGPSLAVAERGLKTRLLAFTSPGLVRLDYALVLNRRYRDASADATMVMLEGEKTPAGGWRTRRTAKEPISYGRPAVAGYVWPKPVPVRGFALLRPMEWAGFAVDVWTGPEDAPVTRESFAADEHWKQVLIHHQTRNHMKYNWHTDRVVYGDLGDVTPLRAIRVRIVEPPQQPASPPRDPVGGFEALVAFQPIGQDAPLPPSLAQRITVVSLPDGPGGEARILGHLPAERPGALAFAADGSLYASVRQGIVRVGDPSKRTAPSAPAEPPALVVPASAAGRPRALAFDADGLLYDLDALSHSVKVFDPRDGRTVRTIGTPGGLRAGPWDPARMGNVSAMAIDHSGKLWIVEHQFQPKRISRWSLDGRFEKEMLGPTHYGGGGHMDPGDRTVVNHYGMKFRIDYDKKSWRLESILAPQGARSIYMPDRVFYLDGRRYLAGERAGTLFGDEGPTMAVCVEREGVAVPLAEAGLLQGWDRLRKEPELHAAFGKLDAPNTSFVWSDLNGDGRAQPAEVQTAAGPLFAHTACVGDDLSLNFRGAPGCRLRAASVRADGLPVYDIGKIETVPELTGEAMATAAGETFVMAHKLLDPAGRALWRWPDLFMGVQMSYKTPWGFYTRPPGELCGSLRPIGHFEIAGEHLFCVNGNNGDYYAFTSDGLLAAAVLGGPRGYGRRFFSMPDCEPGRTDLTDLRATVEDFYGDICRADDGRVYAIAGKQHVTVIRVDGLEAMKRLSGTFTVAADDIRRAMAWAAERARIEQALRRPVVYTVPWMARKPTIDGETTLDWPRVEPMEIRTVPDRLGRPKDVWTARLAFDASCLYIAALGIEETPMMNGATDPKTVFQHGDGFDLHLGLDPKAPPGRTAAAPGDLRLVITQVGGKPLCVLYRYRVAGARLGGEPARFESPTGAIDIDEIVVLTDAQVRIVTSSAGGTAQWTLEAAIPWKALGADPIRSTATLRGDVGALESDPNGVRTVARYYWANKSNVVMSDLPGEARVNPALWGELRFVVPDVGEMMIDEKAGRGADDPLEEPLK